MKTCPVCGIISAPTALRCDCGHAFSAPDVEPMSVEAQALSFARCAVCGGRLARKTTRTFLGFRKVSCEQCPSVLVRPLSTTYRVIYVAVAVWVAFWLFVIAGRMSELRYGVEPEPVPTIFYSALVGTFSAVALWKDYRLRRQGATR